MATGNISTLPRQVVKWVQSLQLAYPARNPKRDFANGYLIAEIFSRYYPNELSVHLLYTGDSNAQKKNNWIKLLKLIDGIAFRKSLRNKHGINIPNEAMDAVMHCHTDAAVRFVENVYTLLTKNSLPQRPTVQSNEDIVPHFALPTTSKVIRCMATSADTAQIVLEAHNDFVKRLRAQRSKELREIMRVQRQEAMVDDGSTRRKQERSIREIHVRQPN